MMTIFNSHHIPEIFCDTWTEVYCKDTFKVGFRRH